jgi:hypothetical protein
MMKRYAFAAFLALGLLAACAPATGSNMSSTAAGDVEPEPAENTSGAALQPAPSAVDQQDQQATATLVAIPDADLPDLESDVEGLATAQAPFAAPNPSKRLMTERAKSDLAQQLNLSPAAIEVVEVQEMQWPDAGLGCPQPDQVYAQVETPGYWILLEAKAQFYPYHTDATDRIQLCLGDGQGPDGRTYSPPLVPLKPGEIDDGQPWVPVD